jgi:L-glutamine-phosphate cytidylyltransferase
VSVDFIGHECEGARHSSNFSRFNFVRVIILAAGQGKRLLPLTADVPKALLDIGGKPLIERQIEAFAAHGISDFAVVTGYAADLVDHELARIAKSLKVKMTTVFNPFYGVADNLASCWMARHVMSGPFIQVNGDNVFRAELVERLVKSQARDVAVAINFKDAYDADDMKVMLDRDRLTEIGKTLPLDTVNAEANGFYVFNDAGAKAYVRELDLAMRDPQNLKRWFPSVIGSLAKKMEIGTIAITGTKWAEVDFPADLASARQLVADWD